MKTKLHFFMATLLLLVVACNKENDAATEIEKTTSEEAVQSFYVTVEEAVATAKRFMGDGDTRSRDLRLKNHTLYNVLSGTRGDQSSDVAFHIVNFEDNKGYAIVSADSRATDVYAFSPTGNIDIDKAMGNPGFRIFMERAAACYSEEMYDAGKEFEIDTTGLIFIPEEFLPTDPPPGSGGGSGGGSSFDVTQLMITYIDGVGYYTNSSGWITDEIHGPLLTTAWGQDAPYNYYCPEKNGETTLAGCAPVAISQIMAYHKYPNYINGYLINWAIATNDSMEEYFHFAARVIREVGKTAGSIYGVKATSTLTSNVRPTFTSLGYSSDPLEAYNDAKVLSSLRDSLPIYIRGYEISEDDGHGWVVDGFVIMKNTSSYYHTYAP